MVAPARPEVIQPQAAVKGNMAEHGTVARLAIA